MLLVGAKGLHKGVREVFGDQALIHRIAVPLDRNRRCQWHKRENVVSNLTDRDHAEKVKQQMEVAYAASTYAEAKERLTGLATDLKASCPVAAASLNEGLEETLTLHKLRIPKPLRDQLWTTNIIESINSRLAHTTLRDGQTRISDNDGLPPHPWRSNNDPSTRSCKTGNGREILIRALKRHQKTIKTNDG